MEPYKTFFAPFYFTKLNLLNINDPAKNRASSRDKKKRAKEKVVAPICGIITIPKEYIKTQKLTNVPNLITWSVAPAPKVIVVGKIWTGISVNSGLTGETIVSVTPEHHIPIKNRNIKSLATSPPIKDPIPNQD